VENIESLAERIMRDKVLLYMNWEEPAGQPPEAEQDCISVTTWSGDLPLPAEVDSIGVPRVAEQGPCRPDHALNGLAAWEWWQDSANKRLDMQAGPSQHESWA
jgi:hypothetical protein